MISTNVMCFPHHIIVELCTASIAIVNRAKSVKVYITIFIVNVLDRPTTAEGGGGSE